MKFDYLKSVSPLELVLFVLFVLYIVFPIDIPYVIASWTESALGMIVLLCIGVYLFMYKNPILGVLFIFVAYELIRRSSLVTSKEVVNQPTINLNEIPISTTPPIPSFDYFTSETESTQERTLEEDIVDLRAPIGKSNLSEYVDSSFKPVSDKTTHVGSLV